jgi:hypothetical protein
MCPNCLIRLCCNFYGFSRPCCKCFQTFSAVYAANVFKLFNSSMLQLCPNCYSRLCCKCVQTVTAVYATNLSKLLQPSMLQFGSTGLVPAKLTPVKVSDTVSISCSQGSILQNSDRKDFGQSSIFTDKFSNFRTNFHQKQQI